MSSISCAGKQVSDLLFHTNREASEVDFETIIDNYNETEYRHTIFTAAYHVLHGATLPTTPKVLQDLLSRLQGISRFFGRDETRNFRDQNDLEIFVESYWNEVCTLQIPSFSCFDLVSKSSCYSFFIYRFVVEAESRLIWNTEYMVN